MVERGIYREELFNGVVEYTVYDSNGVLICKAELIKGYATTMLEQRMSDWLDLVDPIEPEDASKVTLTAASLLACSLLSSVSGGLAV